MKLMKSKKKFFLNLFISNNFLNIKKIFFKKKLIILDYNIFLNFFFLIKKYFQQYIYIILPSGENLKNINSLKIIWKIMIKNNISKKNIIVSFGGGVINDIIGFISFSYFRSIIFSLIPTSLLSQIDSSIGGKNAINYYSKNSIGSINFPILIYINYSIIYYMKKNEFIDGYAEIIKYSLINNKKLFFFLFKKKNIKKIILKSCYIKIKIISQDCFEKHIRSSLNLGHTYAHCIENNLINKSSHGKSVAQGIIFILFLSSIFYNYNCLIIKKIIKLFIFFRFNNEKIKFSNIMLNKFLFDKKFNNKINIVVIKNIGYCIKKTFKKKIIIILLKRYYEI